MSNFDYLDSQSAVFKALGHSVRLYIVILLNEKDYCVQEITEKIGYDISTISRHLTILKSTGIVESRKEGNCIYYSLKAHCVIGFLKCLSGIAMDR
ncbi:MAG: winged helix-turn-helix transcriptional regulator [Deltaproteobacteria bacterium]|nr:winged helix-turn-helix transcriptional regulator [Deltaproteobacteria bacterium]